MSIYAIGDLQGCYDDLLRLLDKIKFNPQSDQLWLVGDLVNRGPKSLECLRFIKSLGPSAVSVLGNHDLHLLALATHKKKYRKKEPTFNAILKANDRDELLHWLRHRPLLHYQEPYYLVHAGIAPQWDLETAKKMAREVETQLQDNERYLKLLEKMYGNTPNRWSNNLTGNKRSRYILNAFTRMRFCDENGTLDFEHKDPPGVQPKELIPWFDMPKRQNNSNRIIFGHWSNLGYSEKNNCYCIDTGCLWGGQLTALRLEKKMERVSLTCPLNRS
ncbi:MAG: symmetrical bis(5'-nucleosyl)-tetraphosphatase [Methylococcales bacterium]|nr:symmetrical bis(5'-nucleosyl)-tetraphosphatase [Methylococcales bacterium]